VIEGVLLKNFQKWEELRVDFDPGVNVITGRTDAGKSSVLRAVKWVCQNRPAGDSVVRNGSGGAECRLNVDGTAVARLRREGGNLYLLGDGEFKAFGSGVPETVAELLNVGDLNFQGQHDAPFWFALSPGEVSRQLNAVVNLDLIDRTLANVASELRQARAEEVVTASRLEDARAERDALVWVKEADAEWRAVETVQKDIAEKRARIASLESLVEKVGRYEEDLREASAALLDAQEAYEVVEKYLTLQERAESLENRLNEVKRLEGESCRTREEREGTESTLAGALKDGCPLCGAPPRR
jgi:exonuclease SbcC